MIKYRSNIEGCNYIFPVPCGDFTAMGNLLSISVHPPHFDSMNQEQ